MSEKEFPIVNPLVEPGEDKAHRVGEAVASLFPTGSVIYSSIITPPVVKRTQAWMANVEKRILALEEAGVLSISQLNSNRPELSALILRLIQATEVSSQEEQLKALGNFAVNAALKPDTDQDRLYIMVEVLKTFTRSHIRLLDLYCNPNKYSASIIANRDIDISDIGLEAATFFGEPQNKFYWAVVYRQLSAAFLVELVTTTLDSKSSDLILSAKPTEMGYSIMEMIE